MEKRNEIVRDELSMEITRQGQKLRLIATHTEDDQWQLSVENERGVNTTWFDYFLTPQSAFDAGMKAIEEEGVAAFTDVKGFEYLLEENG